MMDIGLSGEDDVSHEPSNRFERYLEECRTLVLDEIRRVVPRDGRYRPVLYDLVLDYPLRRAKALRPALSIAACRALGGHLESILASAAALEMYHNAFLIHDDVEDGSEDRRDAPTLHRMHGVPIAVNVGDALLALTLRPLLDNVRLLGLGKALRILDVVARMAQESAEGQALELDWIRRGTWQLDDVDYVRMVYKKTSWYTFVTPLLVAGIVAGSDARGLAALRRFGGLLGIAFQMQDDLLNVTAERHRYGKEIAGDLWEGKHTLILLHALRTADPDSRALAVEAIRKPRWSVSGANTDVKTADDVAFLRSLIDRTGAVEHARAVARRWADRARRSFDVLAATVEPSVHRAFLESLVDYVVDRDR
jgi:geranylgeranyl diphosphate synthase type II